MKASEKKQLKAIGARVRALREKQWISQTQLAYECDTSRSVISSVEVGQFNVGINTLIKIAHALNVTVGDLVDSK